MTSATTESTPLIQPEAPRATSSASQPAKLQRNVTFNPTVSSSSPPSSSASKQSPFSSITSAAQAQQPGPPILSKLNQKLRRRHSQGSPLIPTHLTAPKIGPQRTTKTAQKLKLLPDPTHGEDGPDEESGRDVYAQFTRIKDPAARKDAERLGKQDRDTLPRVTAYCNAASYDIQG
ncbi:hypothetical protein LTS18_007607, partial [Coniosporium uncinatum]